VDESFSAELLKRMERLTVRQRRAIPLIVRARGEGRPWEAILKGEGKVCNWRTFWDGKRGWYHQELFREVLGQAQREYDAAVLRTSVQDAAEGLRRAAPLATDALMELIIGMSDAVAEMRALVSEEEPGLFKKDPLESGEEAGWFKKSQLMLRFRAVQDLVRQGRQAAVAVLDRADIETAVKGQGGADERFAALLADLRGEDIGD
jgi:hypothetical protein